MNNDHNNPQVLSNEELETVRHQVFTRTEFEKRLIATIDLERALREKAETLFIKGHFRTCIHHTDNERESAGCPICRNNELSTEKALRVSAEAELTSIRLAVNTGVVELQRQLLACQLEKKRMRLALKKVEYISYERNSPFTNCASCGHLGFHKTHSSDCLVGTALHGSSPSTILKDLEGMVKLLDKIANKKLSELHSDVADMQYIANKALTITTKLGLGKGGE